MKCLDAANMRQSDLMCEMQLFSDCKGILFPKQVTVHPANEEDMQAAMPYLSRYSELFRRDFHAIPDAAFSVAAPDSRNPYQQMYVAN